MCIMSRTYCAVTIQLFNPDAFLKKQTNLYYKFYWRVSMAILNIWDEFLPICFSRSGGVTSNSNVSLSLFSVCSVKLVICSVQERVTGLEAMKIPSNSSGDGASWYSKVVWSDLVEVLLFSMFTSSFSKLCEVVSCDLTLISWWSFSGLFRGKDVALSLFFSHSASAGTAHLWKGAVINAFVLLSSAAC